MANLNKALIKVAKREFHAKGKLLKVKINGREVAIVITFHARERMEKWVINEDNLLETLIFPEEVLIGHGDRFIAHRRYGDHIVRAVYEYEGRKAVIITVYFPLENRYFQGGGNYEDKILA